MDLLTEPYLLIIIDFQAFWHLSISKTSKMTKAQVASIFDLFERLNISSVFPQSFLSISPVFPQYFTSLSSDLKKAILGLNCRLDWVLFWFCLDTFCQSSAEKQSQLLRQVFF